MIKVMISCQKATELMEKKDIVLLNWREKLQLFFHVKMCSICKIYDKQRSLIDNLIRKNIVVDTLKDEKDLKARIIRKLDK